MAGTSLKSIILGFIAGVIATVTAQELVTYFLVQNGALAELPEPWAMEPAGPFALPQIAITALWGGLWGVIFALILGDPPRGSMTLKGIALGLLGPAVVGALVLAPLAAGRPLFYAGDFGQIAAFVLILAAFGAVTAWLYGFLTSGCRLP